MLKLKAQPDVVPAAKTPAHQADTKPDAHQVSWWAPEQASPLGSQPVITLKASKSKQASRQDEKAPSADQEAAGSQTRDDWWAAAPNEKGEPASDETFSEADKE